MTTKERIDNEILHVQVRLFRLACKKWNMIAKTCADLFDDSQADRYVRDLYDLFHVQGDEANLKEVELYLNARGIKVA